MGIEYGKCHCGCGEKTNIAKQTDKRSKCTKGQPLKFIRGHNRKNCTPKGYKALFLKKGTSIYKTNEHRLLAEKALGKPLPKGVMVHHANGSKNGGTLVICQDRKFHFLLHTRTRALQECGHANWRRCMICKVYDDPFNLKFYRNRAVVHLSCSAEYKRNLHRTNRHD